jgi:uncharacterized membrane protein
MMNNHIFLGLSVFIACAVEMIEALTIILAIGLTRGWRSTLLAMAAALTSLTIVVMVFGRAFMHIPSDDSNPVLQHVWLIMGSLLLIFGLQWMKKAILRFSGLLAKRDESQAYAKTVREARHASQGRGSVIDWYGFVVVYKGVLLEGLEVVFILIAFGVAQNNFRVGVTAALAALVTVALLGVVVHRPLSRVPENTMKLVVGILLTTFGTYFATEGVGLIWPHGQVIVVGILAFYITLSYLLIITLRRVTRFSAAKRATI